MKALRSTLLCLLMLKMLTSGSASAQPSAADTIQARQLLTSFTDGSSLRFQLGPILQEAGDSKTPIGFQTSAVLVNEPIIRTADFWSSGRTSVFWINRILFIHGTDERPVTNFSPNPTFFDGSSKLLYILELRDSKTARRIVSIDTLECYLNSSGNFRFRNHFPSFNWRKFRLPAVSKDEMVYFRLRVERQLPTTSAYKNTVIVLDHEAMPETGLGTTLPYQDGAPIYLHKTGPVP